MTVQQTLAQAAARLKTAGIDSPALDASLLLADVLGLDRARLLLAHPNPLPPDAERRFNRLLERRIAGDCVAYILGRKEFRGLEFTVSPAVLVPRPDTETLVEAALKFLNLEGGSPPLRAGQGPALPPQRGEDPPQRPPGGCDSHANCNDCTNRNDCSSHNDCANRNDCSSRTGIADCAGRKERADLAGFGPGGPCRLLDLCTGSGAVAVALKNEAPGLEVWASDISPEALEIAQRNAIRLLGAPASPEAGITFILSDLFERISERFHLITANPPYVKSAAIPGLSPEVKGEPRLALDGGPDGLDLIRRIISPPAGGSSWKRTPVK
ncbi:MAG: peptide chain release factor N(5)-glutamine methyltransferase [Treponema sp.]|jgi:release factor glutamine methyltransferase|nr:peptide chain release factor N(5)-glutamine methyltransferase [Treponema sp.]